MGKGRYVIRQGGLRGRMALLLATVFGVALFGGYSVWAAAPDTWQTLTAAASAPGNGMALAGAGSDTLFALRGDPTPIAFYRYTISSDTWAALANVPSPATGVGGGALTQAGSDTLFSLHGDNTAEFYRYTISSDTWAARTAVPATVAGGGALVTAGSDTLFALRGGLTTAFYRYTISSDTWAARAAIPATVADGGALVAAGSDTLFASRGNANTDFYRYTISTNSWAARAAFPAFTNQGGALVYPGTGDFIYALRGANGTTCYRYSISADAWTQIADAPATFNATGNALAYPGAGTFIYAWSVGGGGALYRYQFGANAGPDTPAVLAQSRLDGASVAVAGALSDTTSIRLHVRASDPDGDTFRVQIELRSAGTAFTSPVNVTIDTTIFFQSGISASSAAETLTVTVNGLATGSYHWQARVVDAVGDSTGWVRIDGLVSTTHFGIGAGAETTLPVGVVVTSTSGTAVVSPPVGASETFVQVNLSGGDSTPGNASTLRAAALADSVTFATADYIESFALAGAGDTAVLPIWTNQTSLRTFLGLRSDTGTLGASGNLPAGIPATDAGRAAFGATVILAEFSDSTGRLLGDSVTTTYLGDSFAYAVRYLLGETTAARYRALGFDTSPGSSSFRYWYADTYGGVWVEDSTVSVAVRAGVASGHVEITVSGITRDLPGGLGGAGTATATGDGHSGCVLSRGGLPAFVLGWIRSIRDIALASGAGRLLAAIYYSMGG